MSLARAVREYDSVEAWSQGLREQWGGDPLAEEPDKLASLEAFCGFTGKDPDELVAFCFLRKKDSGERFGSVKRRQEMTALLKQFRAESGLPRLEARRRQNDVLSFLIHNGVLISMGVG